MNINHIKTSWIASRKGSLLKILAAIYYFLPLRYRVKECNDKSRSCRTLLKIKKEVVIGLKITQVPNMLYLSLPQYFWVNSLNIDYQCLITFKQLILIYKMFFHIGDLHQFIYHCLIPSDPWGSIYLDIHITHI